MVIFCCLYALYIFSLIFDVHFMKKSVDLLILPQWEGNVSGQYICYKILVNLFPFI